MKKTFPCALLAALVVGGSVIAQERPTSWRNAEFDKQGMPTEQQRPIFKGDFAECSGDARERVSRSLPRVQMCDPSQNFGIYAQCERMQQSLKAQQKSMYEDLAVGCMARKGWLQVD